MDNNSKFSKTKYQAICILEALRLETSKTFARTDIRSQTGGWEPLL